MKTSKSAGGRKGDSRSANGGRGLSVWNRVRDRLRALPAADLAVVNLDVAEAALVAAGVAARVTAAPLRARFAAIAGAEFEVAHVDDLADVAWAAHHAAETAVRLRATGSEARVPLDVVRRATEVEGRMQRCCEYYFAHDPVIAPLLDALRPGTGHRDLATDLKGYAAIYRDRAAVIEHDPVNYRAQDRADAEALAQTILDHIASSLTPEARAAADDLARAWTLLRQVYDEVRAAGLFIERGDPTSAERYPSLFAATRGNQGGRPRKGGEPPAEPKPIPA